LKNSNVVRFLAVPQELGNTTFEGHPSLSFNFSQRKEEAFIENYAVFLYRDQRKRLLLVWPPTNEETFSKVLETISRFWQSFNNLLDYA
jgi:hypothetical protein